MPKISVITVCYNEPEVKRTCDSILGQSSGDYEWLVIDGVSSRYTESYYAERHRMYEKHFDADFLKKYL